MLAGNKSSLLFLMVDIGPISTLRNACFTPPCSLRPSSFRKKPEKRIRDTTVHLPADCRLSTLLFSLVGRYSIVT